MTKASALQKVENLSRKVEKGETSLEQWKWQRAEAMAAAAEAGATQREIAKSAGLSDRAVRSHLRVWREKPEGTLPAYSEAYDKAAGFDRDAAQARTDQARTKKTLDEAPLEQVERIIADLSPERQQAVAAAAGNEYHKARQDYAESERNLTPAEKKEREANRADIHTHAARLTSGFAAMSLVDHIEQATEMLRELVADDAVSSQIMGPIDQAVSALLLELEVARGMAGLEAR